MHVSCRRVLILSLSALLSGSAEPASPWKTTESLTAKIGYDDNLFLQDKNPLSVNPNGAPANAGSMVYTTSLALGVIWSPSQAFVLDTSYSPEITRYDGEYSSEDHIDHNFGAGVSGKVSAWSYAAKGSLLSVDGSKTAPIFGQLGGGPAIGAAPVRDRRAQNLIKASARLAREFDHGFVRVGGAYSDWDFLTEQKSTAGYCNYVDRYEWSVGPEVGRYVRKGFAVVAGVRVGEQHQVTLLGSPVQYSNNFTRYLVGVEGKPVDTLSLAFMAGPDRRDFSPGAGVTIGSKTARYIEASAIWTPTKADTLTLSGKDYLWLNASGKGVYQSSVYDLQWKRALNTRWSFNSGANVQVGDNRPYNTDATKDQNSWIYTASLGATCAITAKTRLDLGLNRSWSDSYLNTPKPGREYTRWQASLAVKYTF